MRSIVAAAGLILPLALAGCSASASGAEGEDEDILQSEEGAIVADGTVALSEADLKDATLEPHRIRFAAPTDTVKNLRPGAILMGTQGDQSFIRRVEGLSYDGGSFGSGVRTLVVETQDAALSEAAPTARTRRRSIPIQELQLDFSSKPFVEMGGASVKCGTCSITYNPSFEYEFDIRRARLQKFDATFDGFLKGDINLEVKADATQSISKTVTLYDTRQKVSQTVGIVPFWASAHVSIVASFDGRLDESGHAAVGFSAGKRTYVNLHREDGKWSTDADGNTTFSFDEPLLEGKLGADATVKLMARVELSVYSVASAYLNVDANQHLLMAPCASPPSWSLNGTFAASAGAEIGLPGVGDKRWDKDFARLDRGINRNLPFRDICSLPAATTAANP